MSEWGHRLLHLLGSITDLLLVGSIVYLIRENLRARRVISEFTKILTGLAGITEAGAKIVGIEVRGIPVQRREEEEDVH